jgi:hypothetical protein
MIMNFSDPSGGGGGVGSVLDSLKMSQQQLTPEQELKHQQQARKGIQTSPDGASHYYIVVFRIRIRHDLHTDLDTVALKLTKIMLF